MGDLTRILFLEQRDTQQEVLKFAVQARQCYRRSVLATKRKFGKHNTYRKRYIKSYLFHKVYILGVS